nr:substrate-binding domain-containing protein [Flexivirga aerilata]
MITDSIASSPFAGQLLGGATDRARERGHLVAVFDSGERPALEEQAAEEFAGRRVDGLIYASMGLREVASVPDVGLPTVLANCFDARGELPSVIPAEEEAGATAARCLLDMGHRQIGVITGDLVVAGPRRLAGFTKTLAESGVKPVAVQELRGGWTIDAGFHATRAMLTRADGQLRQRRPTAIFCVNDRVAAGALLAAAGLGLAVPADLSILGFDDQEELAANLVPSLSTLALPHREMGRQAVDLLLDVVEQPDAPVTPTLRELPSPLVWRESVAAPPPTR